MALLLIDLDKRIGNAKAWRDTFAEQLPDLEIRIWPDPGEAADIEYLAFMHPDFDALPVFPNLKAMFSRSAGVEAFVNHPKLPKAPLGKMEPPGGDPMMTEYVVMHVLRFHRDMPGYQAAQANREWLRKRIVRPEERRVGFLGYGMMAKAPALFLRNATGLVKAWSAYDACDLVRARPLPLELLVDVGTADKFLEVQLRPELFEAACADAGQKLTLRRQAGYDHSYYFIATFVDDHLARHARALGA